MGEAPPPPRTAIHDPRTPPQAVVHEPLVLPATLVTLGEQDETDSIPLATTFSVAACPSVTGYFAGRFDFEGAVLTASDAVSLQALPPTHETRARKIAPLSDDEVEAVV